MKKTLAIILSVIMIFGVMPFSAFAAEPGYDRGAVASNDEEYIKDMNAEQIASVILDWVDREIAKYSDEMKDSATQAVISGFEGFEIDAFGELVAQQIPEITSIDDVIAYKDYLTELGGTFAQLDTTNLITREEAGSAIGFVESVIQFMADNSEAFGRVFRWDSEVFDYGKVGEYILSLDTTDETNKKIVDFYNDYLIGNDIQQKFVDWVAGQMPREVAEGETFDETIEAGILAWFSGVCEDMGILSPAGLEALAQYDLKTTDIYTLVKNFVGLVQSDNQVKIDTYYNYILDTVVRSLLKTTLGQQPVAGDSATLPEGFSATYTDLALLEEISGGTAYYQDADGAYYQITVADGVATAKTLTWNKTIDLENLELPKAKILTGADYGTVVAEYTPTSKEAISVNMYASQKNQDLIANAVEGFEFTGTQVTEEYAALMVADNARELADAFGLEVVMGDELISELKFTMTEIEEMAEQAAFKAASEIISGNEQLKNFVTINSVDVTVTYRGYATEDEFICEVVLSDAAADVTFANAFIESIGQGMIDGAVKSAVDTMIDSDPVITFVIDGLSGDLNLEDAKELLDFIDTDFVIDDSIVDFYGNYDANNGVVGQANNILVKLVNMLAGDAGEKKLNLTAGNNDNFTANLQKICDTVNDVMAAAEDVMNNEDLQSIIDEFGIDFSAILGSLDMGILYAIDFSSVEALWVSVITLGLDIIDQDVEGEEANIVDDIHDAIGDLENLDAMAVAMADYLMGKCIPELNAALVENDIDFALTVPTSTDAKTVEDGKGKDIIMTKAVDVLYEAATKGVVLVNEIANEAIGHIEGEANIALPTVAFALNVEKGENWEATLAALVNRVYELADGIILACDNEYTDSIDKISAVANAILPLGSLASNCAGNGFAFDMNKVLGFIFDDGLNGNLDGFLRLFETATKTEDVAADVSVTEALIVASEHIVDAIFPDTVKSELYVNLADYSAVSFTEETVQEYFTSAENDAVIASNNMDSINARKAELIPAALNLVREAGILPFFAKCNIDHNTIADENLDLIEGSKASCTEAGVEDAYACPDCGFVVKGGEIIPANGHSWGEWTTTTDPKCEAKGKETRECKDCDATEDKEIAATGHVTWSEWTTETAPGCETAGVEKRVCSCGKTETREISATGHSDANGDNICDSCNADLSEPEEDDSFFGKIVAFFRRIIDWFKNLFNF